MSNIGRQRAWSKLTEWAGFSGSALGAFAITYAVFQQPFRLSHLALAATAEALCLSVAIIGMQEGDKAGAKEKALQESSQSDFLITT